MPYNISWEEKGMYIKIWDEFSAEENLQLNGEIYGNKNFDAIKYQIADFLEADTSMFTTNDIKVISRLEFHASVWNKSLKVAHITRDANFIKYVKLYESQMEGSGWEFAIFDNLEDARKWVEA